VTVLAGITETFDIGADTGAPVVDYAGGRNRFNGAIKRIEVKPKALKLLPF
jgi:arylsulfatase